LFLQEVAAARTIAERGVVLVGTAHGNNLSNLMRNPVLRPLVGGVNAVTIGDEMAAKTNGNVKASTHCHQAQPALP
jgi:stage III sporulation protein SpoIIIAA